MDYIYVITSIAFGLCSFFNILGFLYAFQKSNFSCMTLIKRSKEKEIRRYLFSPFVFLGWILLLSYFFVIFDDTKTSLFHISVCIFYMLELLFLLPQSVDLFSKSFVRLKSFLLFTFVGSIVIIFYVFPIVDIYAWLLIIDKLIFIMVIIGVIAFAFPSEVYADFLLEKAMKKVGQRKDIFTIFLIGKDKKKVLHEIVTVLTEKYVVATSAVPLTNMQQTAEILLKNIKNDTQVFVAQIESLNQKELRTLLTVFSVHSIVITSVEDAESQRLVKNIVDEIEKSLLIISDFKNYHVMKKLHKTNIVYYTDTITKDEKINQHVILHTVGKLKTSSFYSFDIFCNEQHLMKLKLPQDMLVEKKLFLPGVYLGLGLDMTISMIKKAYRKRNLL